MISNAIFFRLLPVVLWISAHTLAAGQTTVTVGYLQNETPVLTMTTAQFNRAMATFFPGKRYSDLLILSGVDVQGPFYYIKAKTRVNRKTARELIVLEQSGTDLLFNRSTGCAMQCTCSGHGTDCEITVLEKCRSVRSSCGQPGKGGGSTTIVFPNN